MGYRTIGISIFAFVVMTLGAVGTGFADMASGGYGGYGPHRMMGPGMMGGGWFMGPVMMILFFALLVGAAYVITKIVRGDIGGKPDQGGDDALRILRERLAKGEIDADEYAVRKKALED
ncbi:MAG: SHOCT domain-containing protein [Alphaproteobacteria bacterium]|nr:SHOCT domain-containing protein [Alphaproteobacteria bacterium]